MKVADSVKTSLNYAKKKKSEILIPNRFQKKQSNFMKTTKTTNRLLYILKCQINFNFTASLSLK